MKKIFITLTIVFGLLFFIPTSTYANWGWEPTDNPVPYYYQAWGKWYNNEDFRVFMVQIEESTYKYVFDYNGTFVGGWMTYMPMRLP
jgi:hypothetical protein